MNACARQWGQCAGRKIWTARWKLSNCTSLMTTARFVTSLADFLHSILLTTQSASVVKRPRVRPSVVLSRRSAAASVGGFAAEVGRGLQISIDSRWCRAICGQRKFRTDCKEVQRTCFDKLSQVRFKSQPRRCPVTVLGKLFTPIVPLFTKQRNW